MIAFTPKRVDEAKIAAAVKRLEKALRPDVVRIRYVFAEDWTGDPMVNFNIVLSEDASRDENLGEVARRVPEKFREQLDTYEMGIRPSFNFRSISEEPEVSAPGWA